MFFRSFLLFLMCSILQINTASASNELKDVTLYVVTDPSVPPFSYLKGDYVTPEGIDVDMVFELQKRLGFKLKENRIFPLTLACKMQALKEQKIDLAIGSISATKERAKFMHFSPIYYHAGISILYSTKYSNDVLNGFEDLNNKKVMVLSHSIADDLISKLDKNNLKKVSIFSFNEGLLAVANGKVDAFVSDRDTLEYYANSLHSLNLGVGSKVYAKELSEFAFASPKDAFYNKYIDREIQNMLNDGTIQKIIDKYSKQ